MLSEIFKFSKMLYSTNAILSVDKNVLRFWNTREGQTKK